MAGFSLIELIISIAIIGLLSSIVLPNFARLQESAKKMSVKSISHSVQIALESYYLQEGAYPAGQNIAMAGLIGQLQENENLIKLPTNPYTGDPYSETDESGQIIYSYNEGEGIYHLIGYGNQNIEAVCIVTNE